MDSYATPYQFPDDCESFYEAETANSDASAGAYRFLTMADLRKRFTPSARTR